MRNSPTDRGATVARVFNPCSGSEARIENPCHMKHASRRRRAGFSLLELLVVGMLGVLVITFIGNAWRWFARSTSELHVSAQLARELKLAADAIAADFGPALAARTIDGTTLQINLDGNADDIADWAAPDTVIEYALVGGKLLRRDLAAATEVPVAHIAALEAQSAGTNLNVLLTAAFRDTDHELTLQLEGP